MPEVSLLSNSGAETMVQASTFQAFQASMRGTLIRPGDASYEIARKTWNGMIDKHPALIARCTGVADVITAVRFARDHDLLVAVRGGGHSLPGFSVCEGGMVIDLSLMKGIRVDPDKRTAVAQAGLTWGDYDRETQVFGLASTGGVISTTGIAGLTLGGGIGWLMRKYGLACDHLRSVDLVTADGQCLTASIMEHPDLFWGLRGGGGNFGIATSFEYQLQPVGPVLAGMIIHPIDRAREVLRFYRDFTPTVPDNLTTYVFMLTTPEGVPVVAMMCCYCGDLAAGEQVLQPLRTFGPPLADEVKPMPYQALQSLLDDAYPAGLYSYYKSHYISRLSDELIDTMVDAFVRVASPLSALGFEQFGGAVSRVGVEDTAFLHRGVAYDIAIFEEWADPATSAVNMQWVREVAAMTEPFATGGVYVNFFFLPSQPEYQADGMNTSPSQLAWTCR